MTLHPRQEAKCSKVSVTVLFFQGEDRLKPLLPANMNVFDLLVVTPDHADKNVPGKMYIARRVSYFRVLYYGRVYKVV